MNGHPTDLELLDLIEGRLNPVRAAALQRHLDSCAACRTRQAGQIKAAHSLNETLVRVAGAAPFSPRDSWAAIAPRLRGARRAERIAHTLRLAASAAAVIVFIAALVGLGAFLRPQPAIKPDITPQPVIAPTLAPTPVAPAPPTPRPTGRITILVVGMDRRPGETEPGLTDSMMILSLDRTRHTALMLSIPRDLWIDIPGHGPGRINTVYMLGEKSQADGTALLKQTVNAILGVRVDHVVRLEFNAVVTLIDAIGGVDIDVPVAINDPFFPDSAYGYDPLYIPAGRQHMDGALALKYMRTRHGNSDFDRAARQQQVLTAIRARIAQPDVWPDVLAQAPALIEQLKSAVVADLNIVEMIELAQQAQQVPDGSLRMAVIDGRYVVDYVTPEGAQVLLPLKDRISALVNDMFETGLVPATPEVEMARLSVLNGTTQTGLAARTAAWLRGQGFNVVNTGNAANFDYKQTLIIDHAGRPATVRALAEWLKVKPGNLIYRPEPAAPAEVEIILGADFAPPTP